MIISLDNNVDVFLEHHGVKGQKWGVRNEKSTSNGGTAKGDYDVLVTQGAVWAGVILLAVGNHQLQSGNIHRDIMKLKGSRLNVDKTLANKNMTSDEIMSKVVPNINPGFKKGTYGSKANCRRATFAYELRRRGYDVAATRTSQATGQNTIGLYKAITPGAKRSAHVSPTTGTMKDWESAWGKTTVAPNSVFKTLAKQPNGARGEFGMGYTMGGGHSMAWEIVKGKPVIFDTQKNKKYSSQSEFAGVSHTLSNGAITRLDNVKLNDDFLLKWVKNA